MPKNKDLSKKLKESDELLHHAKIQMDILKKHELKPSKNMKGYLQKENIHKEIPKRFKLVMATEEIIDSLNNGGFSKPIEIKCNDVLFDFNREKDSIGNLTRNICELTQKERIKELRIKIQHKRFSDITAIAQINERKKNEYHLKITFQGDITGKELTRITNSLNKKFPKKDSAEYRRLEYSTGSYTGADKATLVLFGPMGVIFKRGIQKIGGIFRKIGKR